VLHQVVRARAVHCVMCHAAWSQAIFGPAVRSAGAPLAFWAHDALSGRHWIERLARRVAPDLAVANSHYTAGTLPSVYPGVPVAVVHPPVEVAAFAASADAGRLLRAQVRAEFTTPGDAVVIVQASRMEAWKGHSVLLEALPRLRSSSCVVWLAGGAQRKEERAYAARLERLVTDLGLGARVRFLGERSDVARVLGAADILCQANLLPEPFGIALVEGLAAGLPVVTAALGGAVEIVNDSCGMVVPADRPDALAAALDVLVADAALRARLAAAAPARAREVADPGRQLSALHAALTQLPAPSISA